MDIRELLEAYKKIDFDAMEDETGLNEEKKPEIKKAEYKEIKPKKPETEKVKGIAEEVNNEEEESIDEDIESFSNKLDNATRDLKDLIKDLQKTNESLEMNEVSDQLVDKALGKAQREVIKGKMIDDKELENKGKKHLKGLKKQAEKREKRKCESLNEFYDVTGMDSIEMELVSFGKGEDEIERFELDGVEFYRLGDEDLQNAVDMCIEEEFFPEWQEQGLSSYNVDSIKYDEEEGKGTVYVGLFWDDLDESLNETKNSYRSFVKDYIEKHPECKDKKVNDIYFDIADAWKENKEADYPLFIFKDNVIKYIKTFLKNKNESLNEDVVAKFDGGKHEIVKCKEGYFNRYNIKEGKARFTTNCVESLPTALRALKKRFPKAEEDK